MVRCTTMVTVRIIYKQRPINSMKRIISIRKGTMFILLFHSHAMCSYFCSFAITSALVVN